MTKTTKAGRVLGQYTPFDPERLPLSPLSTGGPKSDISITGRLQIFVACCVSIWALGCDNPERLALTEAAIEGDVISAENHVSTQGDTDSALRDSLTSLSAYDCDYFLDDGCPPPPPPPPNRRADLGFSLNDCSVGTDYDSDGIDDRCEYDVARAFRPQLKYRREDDVRREEYWEVRPWQSTTTHGVVVFYGLGYYRDTGTSAANGWDHAGDSEFVVVYVRNMDDRWWVQGACLSAHWGETWAGISVDHSECTSDLEIVGDGGRFRVWVATGKHANYATRDKCEGGAALNFDHCEGVYLRTEFNVVYDARFGMRDRLRVWSSRKRAPGNERFWDPHYKFCGWQLVADREEDCATSYEESLTHFGFS